MFYLYLYIYIFIFISICFIYIFIFISLFLSTLFIVITFCRQTEDEVKQSLEKPRGFQDVEAIGFQDNRHMKVATFTPQVIFLLLISLRAWSAPGAIVRLEGHCQWKITIPPSGIEPAIFRLLAQCVKQLRHHVTRRKQLVCNVYNVFLILTKCFKLNL